MRNQPPLVIANRFDPEYDEAQISRYVFDLARHLRFQHQRVFWLLINGYEFNDEFIVDKMEERYPGLTPLVFRIAGSQNSRTFEYHSFYGGLYRLNVEDVLQQAPFNFELGRTCNPIDHEMVRLTPFLEAVELVNPRENSRTLRQLGDQRAQILRNIRLSRDRLESDEGISRAHEIAFDRYRSDIIVIDNDFLPFSDQMLLTRELGFRPPPGEENFVHLWFSRNPVNGLEYGHGGIKVFPRVAQTRRRKSSLPNDFTLSVGKGVVIHPTTLGIHNFNWSGFSAWSTAARECAKLSIVSSKDKEAGQRLDVWVNNADQSVPFWQQCIAGATYGALHPHDVLNSPDLESLYLSVFKGEH